MSRIKNGVLETIGSTPMVRLRRMSERFGVEICAKVEMFNPGGSIKDRLGVALIEAAEASGELLPGGTVVEATAGNTGIGLALAAAVKGYRCVFVMPDKMSAGKAALLEAYGAEVVWAPTVNVSHPEHYIRVARRIAREKTGGWLANQFDNPVNVRAHYEGTGPEIWEDTGGALDAFVAGMGTTGTVTGAGRFLKEKKPSLRVVVADPMGSVFGGGPPGVYLVEGIGNDHDPGIYDASVVDEFIYVEDKDAFRAARRLTREEGLFVGGSSGTALVAVEHIAADMEPGQRIVVMLPDSGRNYLAKLYNDDWMRARGFLEEEG